MMKSTVIIACVSTVLVVGFLFHLVRTSEAIIMDEETVVLNDSNSEYLGCNSEDDPKSVFFRVLNRTYSIYSPDDDICLFYGGATRKEFSVVIHNDSLISMVIDGTEVLELSDGVLFYNLRVFFVILPPLISLTVILLMREILARKKSKIGNVDGHNESHR